MSINVKPKKNSFLFDAVIFDFDGTIAQLDIDWSSASQDLINLLKVIDDELFESLSNKKMGLAQKINEYSKKYGANAKNKISALTLNQEDKFVRGWSENREVIKAIRRLKSREICLFIWTLNTKPLVHKILKEIGLDNYFADIISFESSLYVKPNSTGLTELIKKYNLKKPLYIGDSYYDEIAAQEGGVSYLNFGDINTLFDKLNNF